MIRATVKEKGLSRGKLKAGDLVQHVPAGFIVMVTVPPNSGCFSGTQLTHYRSDIGITHSLRKLENYTPFYGTLTLDQS